MATTLVEVFNLALSACGAEASITDPDEKSREAALCRLWLPQVRDQVIASGPWLSARTVVRLIKSSNRLAGWDESDPHPGYPAGYSLPADFLVPWHLQTYMPFTLAGGFVHTADPDPILHYMRAERNPANWDHQLTTAIINLLAAYIARPLTGNNEIVSEKFQLVEAMREEVLVQAANMLPPPPTESLPDWITARGYHTLASDRYIHSFSPLNPVIA